MSLIYKVRTASREQILWHLEQCDAGFPTPLSSRVDLPTYARKLHEKAVSFEAWDGDILVGMLNAYLNDFHSRVGFVTNQSVLKEYAGKGVGSILMRMCLQHATGLGMIKMRAEISRNNAPINRVLARAGYKPIGEAEEYLLMECEIGDNSTKEQS